MSAVFDDGDEKTLRRSSLCLKGARHFAESEVSSGPSRAGIAGPPPVILALQLPMFGFAFWR